jgi:hypothetical protein
MQHSTQAHRWASRAPGCWAPHSFTHREAQPECPPCGLSRWSLALSGRRKGRQHGARGQGTHERERVHIGRVARAGLKARVEVAEGRGGGGEGRGWGGEGGGDSACGTPGSTTWGSVGIQLRRALPCAHEVHVGATWSRDGAVDGVGERHATRGGLCPKGSRGWGRGGRGAGYTRATGSQTAKATFDTCQHLRAGGGVVGRETGLGPIATYPTTTGCRRLQDPSTKVEGAGAQYKRGSMSNTCDAQHTAPKGTGIVID